MWLKGRVEGASAWAAADYTLARVRVEWSHLSHKPNFPQNPASGIGVGTHSVLNDWIVNERKYFCIVLKDDTQWKGQGIEGTYIIRKDKLCLPAYFIPLLLIKKREKERKRERCDSY